MALMTGEQYEESLRKLNLKVYLLGELVKNPVDHPIIRPSMNSVKLTYALAQDPQYEDLMTATSHLTGNKINRFCHLHRSTDDLVKKVKMQRLLGQKSGACFQRCVGMDAINAVDSVTFEMDQKLGTKYHERFNKFLLMMQEEDLTVDGAMTDPKGDRGLPPHKQPDPDLYVRIVERKAGRHCRTRCKSAPDRGGQLTLDSGHAYHDHGQGGCRLRCLLRRSGRCGGHLLHLRPPVLRYPQIGGQPDRCRQQPVRGT